MPRIPRILISGEQTVYHIMSRTALDGFPFGSLENDFLTSLIQRKSKLYFTEILGFCCMGNHFHLLVRMLPETDFSDSNIKNRYKKYYGDTKNFSQELIPFFRDKWSSLSEFIKEIKQEFSRFYNKRHNRRGFFWGERFKSVIVENGETLVNCLAYIDLNPVRAGIVKRPEEYRWNSIGYHLQTGNKDDFLSTDFGLKEFGELEPEERLRRYRKFLYETGAIDKEQAHQIDANDLEKERQKNFNITRAERFRYRTRYFSDSGIIGSKRYVNVTYQRIKSLFQSRDKKPVPVKGLHGVYSLKRLAL